MGHPKWEAYLIHAEQFITDSMNDQISEPSRAFLAVMAGELALKSLYYKNRPHGDIKVHISRNLLLNKVCHPLGITPTTEVLNAVDELRNHYNAPRYPEETTVIFSCEVAQQASVYHYGPIIEDLIKYAQVIIDWVKTQLD